MNSTVSDDEVAISRLVRMRERVWAQQERRCARYIRKFCAMWADSDQQAQELFARAMTGRDLPGALAMVVLPLLATLESTQDIRRRFVDPVLPKWRIKQARSSAPDLPPIGFLSRDEVRRRLGMNCQHVPKLARMNEVKGLAANGFGSYFDPVVVTAVERDHKTIAESIGVRELSNILGVNHRTIHYAVQGKTTGCVTIPPMRKIKGKWRCSRIDLALFQATTRTRPPADAISTRDAADLLGVSKAVLTSNSRIGRAFRRQLKVVFTDWQRRNFYRRADVEQFADDWRQGDEQQARQAERAAAELCRAIAREEWQRRVVEERQRRDDERRQRTIERRQRAEVELQRRRETCALPADAIPIADALALIGMTQRRFDKIRQGLSGTPIPRWHKHAITGRLYVQRVDLVAFLADRQANRATWVRHA
jgi:hypothetical protein